MSDWQPIETAPSNEGWIGPCLFAKKEQWGWEIWVGQCDDGNIWLARCGEGICADGPVPTHWTPLPNPPLPGDHP
jgi:hypothetical protein